MKGEGYTAMNSNLILLQADPLEIMRQSLTHSILSTDEALILPAFNHFWTSDTYRYAVTAQTL